MAESSDSLKPLPITITLSSRDRLVDNDILIQFDYTNHRGERALRTVRYISTEFGVTTEHSNATFLLKGFCLSRNAIRYFEISKMENVIIAPVEGRFIQS